MVVFASGSGELLVIGYAECDFNAHPHRYEQISDAHTFLGLQWRLDVYMAEDMFQPANDMGIHPLLLHCWIKFKDPGEQGTPTVYSARVKLSILLPNRQLVAERQDQLRHRFSSSGFTIDERTNPELAGFPGFPGNPGQFLTESFIFKAEIEACSEPTILHSPNYHHAIEVGPFEKGNYCSMFVSGYVKHLRRLVFWIVTTGRVTCWAVNPLVPSSLERLCRRETELRDILQGAGALSHQQHLAACVTTDYFRSFHLHILVLGTDKLLHRCYARPANFDDDIRGLGHTRRGWIMFTMRAFYLTAVKSSQMELLMSFDPAPFAHPTTLSVNYNSLLASYHNENRIQVWDLGSAELNSHNYYDHQLTAGHGFCMRDDQVLVKEDGEYVWDDSEDRALLSMMEFEDNHCRATPCYLLRDCIDYIGFDGEKVFFVEQLRGNEMVVQTVWLPGRIPTAKELATMEIQRRTGRQRMIRTALGDKSVWTGGLTEDMIREILRITTNSATAIMN